MIVAQTTKLPFGVALALAQRTLTAPLAAVLSTEDLAMPQWFTLNTLGLRGPTRMAALSDLLATNGLDAAAAKELIAALSVIGLVDLHDDTVSLTPKGTARYTGLRDRISAVNTRIFDQFDAERVENARSLLQEIADIDPDQLTRRSVQAD
jgi:DNA-binding MarR family transcriptional regulator